MNAKIIWLDIKEDGELKGMYDEIVSNNQTLMQGNLEIVQIPSYTSLCNYIRVKLEALILECLQ